MKHLRTNLYYIEFKQLFQFILNPSAPSDDSLTIVQKLKGTWRMLVVKFLLAILVGVSIGVFYDPENLTKISLIDRFSTPALILLTVFILPLLEEVGFRLTLIYKPIYLALTSGTLSYYWWSKAIYHSKLSDIHHHLEERLLISIATILITYLILRRSKINHALELFWKKHFRWIFYFFSFGFAWVHIFNYELSLFHLLLMPILTLDKLTSAFCYGYTRVNYGFLYSLAIHGLNNSVGLTISLLASGPD